MRPRVLNAVLLSIHNVASGDYLVIQLISGEVSFSTCKFALIHCHRVVNNIGRSLRHFFLLSTSLNLLSAALLHGQRKEARRRDRSRSGSQEPTVRRTVAFGHRYWFNFCDELSGDQNFRLLKYNLIGKTYNLFVSATKAKNLVVLQVDNVVVAPGRGEEGWAHTNTQDELYFGGVPGNNNNYR